MLQIRPEQLEQLEQHALETFARRVARYLRDHLAARTVSLTDAQLLALARDGVLAAESYGVTIEWDLCRFVQHQLRLGPDFHTAEPWAAAILAEPDLNGTSKLDRLDHYYFHVLDQE